MYIIHACIRCTHFMHILDVNNSCHVGSFRWALVGPFPEALVWPFPFPAPPKGTQTGSFASGDTRPWYSTCKIYTTRTSGVVSLDRVMPPPLRQRAT